MSIPLRFTRGVSLRICAALKKKDYLSCGVGGKHIVHVSKVKTAGKNEEGITFLYTIAFLS